MNSLQLVLLLLAAAVLVVTLFRRLGLPPILGYLLVGVLIGPHALNFIKDVSGAEHLAEFGVVFLMFSIGLEFSLPKLYAMKRVVFGLGLMQVLLTIVLAVGLSVGTGLGWQAGVALGGGSAEGPLVCSCFKVGKNRLLKAIREQGLTTPQQVTACLKAGGNCGSCVPEIRGLIASCQAEDPCA